MSTTPNADYVRAVEELAERYFKALESIGQGMEPADCIANEAIGHGYVDRPPAQIDGSGADS